MTFLNLITNGQSGQFGQVSADSYHQHNPGVSVKIDDLVAEDDKVVGRFGWMGTRIGSFQYTPATHKRVS